MKKIVSVLSVAALTFSVAFAAGTEPVEMYIAKKLIKQMIQQLLRQSNFLISPDIQVRKAT